MSNNEQYTRIYVGGLNESIQKEDLQVEFEKFGKLNKVWIAFNPPGFAFIEYLSMDEAETACNSMNGTEIMGAKLRVEISRGRARGSRGGSRGRGYTPRGGYDRGGSGGYDRGGTNYHHTSRGGTYGASYVQGYSGYSHNSYGSDGGYYERAGPPVYQNHASTGPHRYR
ncbi:hypothetical protein QAD02_000236 [Eretmocerus hayati]|uniref:Uncharacterized protein n=1 Tax=Eretmocerus hayati TaxID=131215 RepID=A0ACC2ND37_9HYME|nr:hypothetical protein QAD02_000236 [Eretmocerus hayati]